MKDFRPATQKVLSVCMQDACRQALAAKRYAGLWMDNEEYTHAQTEHLVKTGMPYSEVAKALERMMKHET